MKLRLTGPEQQVLEFDLGSGTLSIGRATDNDVILADKTISRHHCLLSMDEDEGVIVLEDGDSRYGTDLNGELLEGASVLSPDDRFTIGMWFGEIYDETVSVPSPADAPTRELSTMAETTRQTMRSTRKTRTIDGILSSSRTTRILFYVSGSVLLALLILYLLTNSGA